MFNGWIEKTDELPDGIMLIDESLRPTLNKVHKLSQDDLIELEAFLDYLLDEPGKSFMQRVSARICDFMAAGMQKVS